MFKDFLRRLTADYTEAEYENYIAEIPYEPPTAHRIERCEELGSWVDLDMNADEWYYAPKLHFTSMKDIVAALQRVAEETGYDLQFLCEMAEESRKDGDDYEEAVEHVAGVSYEQDW